MDVSAGQAPATVDAEQSAPSGLVRLGHLLGRRRRSRVGVQQDPVQELVGDLARLATGTVREDDECEPLRGHAADRAVETACTAVVVDDTASSPLFDPPAEAVDDRCAIAQLPRCEGLAERFATPWPLPTTAPSDPGFDRQRYWRGPTWVNINWLMADQAGFDVVEPTLRLLDREGFREYFDPLTGEGLGARDFSWSAALALDWLADV